MMTMCVCEFIVRIVPTLDGFWGDKPKELGADAGIDVTVNKYITVFLTQSDFD